jgi:hypothetical protein
MIIGTGARLVSTLHDGTPTDAVYAVDAQGRYLGVRKAADAPAAASCAPPSLGSWRWNGSAWAKYTPPEQRVQEIELARDTAIGAGVTWSGRRWYADPLFQSHLVALLAAYTEGILQPTDTVSVRSMDKVVYQLTRAEVRQLAGIVLAFVQQQFVASWAAKAAIQA